MGSDVANGAADGAPGGAPGDGHAGRRAASAALGVAVGAAILAAAFAISPNFEASRADAVRSAPYAGDFLQEYAGGWIVREGDRSRSYDPDYFRSRQRDPALTGFRWEGGQSFPPIYPPFYYLWVSPLSRLDYRAAAHAWTALGVAALAASVAMLVAIGGGARRWVGWACAASLCYAPVMESILSGQKGTQLLLLFTATLALLRRERLFTAGAVFGCAAFKPQLVLVVAAVLLAKRQWRFAAGMAATGAALAAQSLWAFGWEGSLAWVSAVLRAAPQSELVARSHSWIGFVRLLTGQYAGPAVLALAAALVAATAVALHRLLRGPLAFGSARFRIQFAGMVIATALVSPHLYTYDLSILALPLLIGAAELRPDPAVPPGARRQLLAALLLVFLMGAASTAIAQRIPLQASALASFALLIAMIRWSRQLDPSPVAVAPERAKAAAS